MISLVTTKWIYPGGIPNDEKFDAAQAEAVKQLSKFESMLGKNQAWLDDHKLLLKILDELEQLSAKNGPGFIEEYIVYLASRLDGAEPKYKAMIKRAEEFDIQRATVIRRFTHALARASAKQQAAMLAETSLKNYHYFLKNWFVEQPHLLGDEAEDVMNRLSDSAIGSWIRLNEERLSLSEVNLKPAGKVSFEQLISLMSSSDEALAAAAAKSFNKVLKDHLPIAEAEFNAVLSYKKADDQLRHYKYPDDQRLETDEISRTTVHTLIDAVTEQEAIAQRYYDLKARIMGKDKLKYHERNTPVLIGGAKEPKYGYEQAYEMVRQAFNSLSPQFTEVLERYHANGQVDVYPKTGKRGGAFMSSFAPSAPGYVMLNFTNKLDDVSTLAHEFGHAIHFEFAKKAQNALLYDVSMATAEVASTFMEDFILEDIIAGADDATRLNIIMERLNRDVSSIFRQIAFYRFELKLHEAYRKAGYLSAVDVGKLFQAEMVSYMGQAVEQNPGSENWWIYVGHFRRFFYVYSYASGLLISKSLQRRVRADAGKIDDVIKVFEAGASMPTEDIFKSAGIDIRQKKFWTDGLAEINDQLDAAEKLAAALPKSS